MSWGVMIVPLYLLTRRRSISGPTALRTSPAIWPEAERAERLAIGTLVSRDVPDFNTQYELVKSRAQKG